MEKLLTIIVPVYNVRKYLKKCVDSVLAQTYNNIEIILVDDGSPDDCGMICDSYKEKDNRIKVIHKTNGGLSSARNAGLDIAKGEYIGFVDSDDWIENTMYEKMISLIESEGCDMVECAVNLVRGDKITYVHESENDILSGRDALMRYLDQQHHYAMPRPAVWSKLYKKSFWKENRFPEGEIHEDYLLTCKALFESKKVGVLNRGLYNHLTNNSDSICNAKFSKRDLYKRNQFEYIIDYLSRKNDAVLHNSALVAYFCYLVTAIWKCDQNGLNDEKYENIKIVQDNKNTIEKLIFPWKKKVDLFLIIYYPSIFLYFRRFLSRIRK